MVLFSSIYLLPHCNSDVVLYAHFGIVDIRKENAKLEVDSGFVRCKIN